MATIIDPNGTISVVYRDPSVTVQTVNGAGNSSGTATPLTILSATNVVLVNTTAGNTGVILPASAQAGDWFEIYQLSGPAMDVYDGAGNLIIGGQLRFDGTNWRQ